MMFIIFWYHLSLKTWIVLSLGIRQMFEEIYRYLRLPIDTQQRVNPFTTRTLE